MKSFRIFLTILTVSFLTMGKAHALAGAWQSDDALSLRLISATDGVGTLPTLPLALEIKLNDGWHTYWRSPGEAGLPPQINWQKSQSDDGNLKSAALLYPAPSRYTAFGLETIGYRDYVVLPIDATLRTPGKPLTIDAELDILVCSQICVPKHFNLTLAIPEGPATPSAEAPLIQSTRAKVPGNAATSGLSLGPVTVHGQDLIVTVKAQRPLENPDLFIENSKYIDFTTPKAEIAPDRLSAHFTTKPMLLPQGVRLDDLSYTFTVTDGDHALEQTATIDTGVEAAPPPPLPLDLMILFAIIGGFILNLMPCVLPVLSLKILSVVSHGGGETRIVRHSFLVTAAGILFSFLALATATIGLKEAGMAVGWGVQYQQPLFLGCLVLLLTFFAANMWGLFEIRLPRWLADNFSGPYHPKLAGDFAAGAFATLLATPCSAPFLGTAVGFALANGPREILMIFAALGFGMSLPYLAVASMPRIATALPKPGRWMIHLRHFLAWALALTAAWLIWVLAAQISLRGAFVFALCMVAMLGLFGLQYIRPRFYTWFGILALTLLAFGTLVEGALDPSYVASIDPAWQKFDESAIAKDVDDGKTVFVDVTAGWCLTCKANKKFVLSRDDVTARLFGADTIAMQADWTNPDPAITAFLQKYKRFGIPFNIVFGPGAPHGIVLPELLTPQRVLDALDKASL